MGPQRGVLLPLVLLAAGLSTVCHVFVQPLLPSCERAGRTASISTITGMNGRGKRKKSDKALRKFNPLNKTRTFNWMSNMRGGCKLKFEKLPDVMDWPESVSMMLHVEYEQNPINWRRYPKFAEAVEKRLGHRGVRVMGNDPKALAKIHNKKELIAEGRPGSFEIVDVETNELLFSKYALGGDIIEMPGYLERFIDKLEAKLPEELKDISDDDVMDTIEVHSGGEVVSS